MRYTIQHPTKPNVKAIYGWDPTAIGYFLEVRRAGKLVCIYNGLHSGQTTPRGVLSRLTEHRFMDELDLHEAMSMLAIVDAEDIEEPALRRAATVITNLRQSAAGG